VSTDSSVAERGAVNADSVVRFRGRVPMSDSSKVELATDNRVMAVRFCLRQPAWCSGAVAARGAHNALAGGSIPSCTTSFGTFGAVEAQRLVTPKAAGSIPATSAIYSRGAMDSAPCSEREDGSSILPGSASYCARSSSGPERQTTNLEAARSNRAAHAIFWTSDPSGDGPGLLSPYTNTVGSSPTWSSILGRELKAVRDGKRLLISRQEVQLFRGPPFYALSSRERASVS
jgi:hypothetical protein